MTKLMKDPRDYQIMVLASMLAYGLFWLNFNLNLLWIFTIVIAALLTQFAASRAWKLPRFEWRSALISGLSLSLLMRCPSLELSLVLAAAAILSKFVFRWNEKHIFNPTNFALALGILGTSQVTIDPSQWGQGAILAFFILCMGIFVANKACRSDVSFAFLAVFASSLLVHALWTGLPLLNVLLKLKTGSLLIFAFFMISDPKSTPNSRLARVIFGATTALVGTYLQIAHGVAAGLIISLVFMSLTTPLLDWLFPAEKFEWNKHAVPAGALPAQE